MITPNVSLQNKTVLITGAAGFIGANLVKELIKTVSPIHIVGIDNLNDYYDVSIKEYRLGEIEALVDVTENAKWDFIKGNIADKNLIDEVFSKYSPAVVVNLAAQAGVRYSITNPDVYIESNIIGFYNILEACRHNEVEHLVYASSSSVYGTNKKIPIPPRIRSITPYHFMPQQKRATSLWHTPIQSFITFPQRD